jgi:protein ImuB
MELDTPIELLDSLCFVFQRLLDDLLTRLVRASRSTNEVRVTLVLEGAPDHTTTLRLPVPMTDSKALMKLLHLELSENRVPNPAPH